MDESFQRASYHDGYSRPPQRRYRSSSSNWSSHGRKHSNYSYLTGPNVGIVVAILVIYLFQKKDGFGRLLAARRERGLANALMEWFLELWEYVIAYSQLALDVLRNLQAVSLDDWLPYDLNAATTQNSTSFPSGSRGRRRNMSAQASRMTTSQMPELEETDMNKLEADKTTRSRCINIGPLEPAFLRDEDYPPGWLVFDPVLGVVSKAEADKRKEQERKRTTGPQQAPLAQPPMETPRPPATKELPRKPQSPSPFKPNPTNKSAPARPIRSVIQKASPIHTPHPIVANG